MRGDSTHFAPRGADGILIGQLSLFGTFIVNAIHFPSGDHARSVGDSFRCVTCDVAPSASIQRTQICEPVGWPGATYAIRVPSGDQRTLDPSTSARFFEPSTPMIH